MRKLIINAVEKYAQYRIKNSLKFDFKDHVIYPEAQKEKKYLLYLHIPFCKVFCPYCSFHKYIFEENRAREYYATLRKEIKIAYELGFDFSSIYIGGGTPTILPDELAQTIDLCRKLWDIKEVSCEADPDISDELIELLKSRVDRLSVGVQSLDAKRLNQTKRCEKFGTPYEQMKNIEKLIANFKIINCDLIFNFPNQTKEELRKDIRKLKSLSPHQISIYPLMYSPLVKKDIEKNMGTIDIDREFEYYKIVLNEIKNGYVQNTCWAFSRDSDIMIDEYVVDHVEYLGLGSGAFGFIKDTLYINTFALDEYKRKVDNGMLSIERHRTYSINEILDYRMMVDMFGFEFSMEKLVSKYGPTIKPKLSIKLFLLRMLGIIDKDNFPTNFGKYIFLMMMKEFYIGMDMVREVSRRGIDRYGMSKNKLSTK